MRPLRPLHLAAAAILAAALSARPFPIRAEPPEDSAAFERDVRALVASLAPRTSGRTIGADRSLVPVSPDSEVCVVERFRGIACRLDGPFIQYAIDDHPLRLVGLDTLDEGRIGGRLCAARLEWLERTLARVSSS